MQKDKSNAAHQPCVTVCQAAEPRGLGFYNVLVNVEHQIGHNTQPLNKMIQFGVIPELL